jgi:hypothetical protein
VTTLVTVTTIVTASTVVAVVCSVTGTIAPSVTLDVAAIAGYVPAVTVFRIARFVSRSALLLITSTLNAIK